MESTDLKQVLSGPATAEPVDVEDHIKTTDKHILSQSHGDDININDMLGFIEDDKEPEPEPVSMYDKDWTKLEKGMKLNRLKVFVESETIERDLNETQQKILKNLLFKMCNDGLFNKANIVEYANEKITTIKIIEYDEATTTYIAKREKKKVRTTPKSKSNLDRLLKKNKS